MAEEHLCMAMGEATGDCTPVQLDGDIWTQVATHCPGNAKGPLSLANRSILYRLHPPGGGSPFLVILNALWCSESSGEPIASIGKFADSNGLPVAFILTPGSGHHLSLDTYARAFPDARVCIPAGRIERHNPGLLEIANVETYTHDSVPPELAAAGLDVLVWQGLWEGPLAKRAARLEGNFSYELGDIQPQCFLHRPSGTLSNGGHHMWYRDASGAEVLHAPGFVKWMAGVLLGVNFKYMQPGKMKTEPSGGYTVSDRDALQATARALLAWDFDRMIDFHAGPNSQVHSGAHALFEETLAPIVAGDWDKVSWKLRPNC